MISKAKPKSEKLLFARFDSFSGAPFFLLCIFSTLQDFSRTLGALFEGLHVRAKGTNEEERVQDRLLSTATSFCEVSLELSNDTFSNFVALLLLFLTRAVGNLLVMWT